MDKLRTQKWRKQAVQKMSKKRIDSNICINTEATTQSLPIYKTADSMAKAGCKVFGIDVDEHTRSLLAPRNLFTDTLMEIGLCKLQSLYRTNAVFLNPNEVQHIIDHDPFESNILLRLRQFIVLANSNMVIACCGGANHWWCDVFYIAEKEVYIYNSMGKVGLNTSSHAIFIETMSVMLISYDGKAASFTQRYPVMFQQANEFDCGPIALEVACILGVTSHERGCPIPLIRNVDLIRRELKLGICHNTESAVGLIDLRDKTFGLTWLGVLQNGYSYSSHMGSSPNDI
jgi:hypothetical protein